MIAPIEPATLSAAAQKILQPSAPPKMRELAARGVAPGVKPHELLTLLVVFLSSDQPTVKETAESTLSALPAPLAAGALVGDLPPIVIDEVARRNGDNLPIIEKLCAMSSIAPETLQHLARTSSEPVTELIATNEERLLQHPKIIEQLYLNKQTRMSTADRLVELASRHNIELSGIPAWREVVAAVQGELIAEPSQQPTPDDLLFRETQQISDLLSRDAEQDTHVEDDEGQEKLKNKFLPLHSRLANMTISQRVRRAMLGSRDERMLLVRDINRMVATAAIRSPLIQEDEVVLISRNRNISDVVLRVIASTPEWKDSYLIKKNLVENPKTPVAVATQLVQQLREADLRGLAKSKNITTPVRDAARRHLDRRKI